MNSWLFLYLLLLVARVLVVMFRPPPRKSTSQPLSPREVFFELTLAYLCITWLCSAFRSKERVPQAGSTKLPVAKAVNDR